MTASLIAPSARARFVVTLPPEPSCVAEELQRTSGASFTTLTDTKDAFLHLVRRARERLVIMTPFIDALGAAWAADIFEATSAKRRELVLRGSRQLDACGSNAPRLRERITRLHEYAFLHDQGMNAPYLETFHAKDCSCRWGRRVCGISEFSVPVP
jgi:hypothetical protein